MLLVTTCMLTLALDGFPPANVAIGKLSDCIKGSKSLWSWPPLSPKLLENRLICDCALTPPLYCGSRLPVLSCWQCVTRYTVQDDVTMLCQTSVSSKAERCCWMTEWIVVNTTHLLILHHVSNEESPLHLSFTAGKINVCALSNLRSESSSRG